jgi:hypothetical protein
MIFNYLNQIYLNHKTWFLENPPETSRSQSTCQTMFAISKESANQASSGILYPINHFHSLSNVFDSQQKFVLAITNASEPSSYKEASNQDCWVKVVESELNALKHNKTWIFVDKPPNIKPIGSKWVYKVKHKADNTIERYKARLVAKGYNQVKGLDLFDTF